MTTTPDILGAILAGGSSRRMFPQNEAGGDKGLAGLAGRPMLAHVIAALRPQVPELILNANGDPERFSEFGLTVVADRDPAAGGPLAGLLAAMLWAKGAAHQSGRGVSGIVTAPADTPFLPADLVSRLREAGGGTSRIAVAASAGLRHPTIGIWPLALAHDLAQTLARGELSANRFAERHGAIEVMFPLRKIGGRDVDPFFNANTPDDLAEAHALLLDINSNYQPMSVPCQD